MIDDGFSVHIVEKVDSIVGEFKGGGARDPADAVEGVVNLDDGGIQGVQVLGGDLGKTKDAEQESDVEEGFHLG